MNIIPNIKSIILFVCLLCLLSACEETFDCFKGTGKMTVETRNLGSFSSLHIDDDIHVELVQDSITKVEIRAGSNLMDELETSVIDGTLYLRNNNACKWGRSYKHEIHATVWFQSLNSINYRGSGMVRSGDTLHVAELDIFVKGNGSMELTMVASKMKVVGELGAGDLVLRGTTDLLDVAVYHAGLFDFLQLKANSVKIHHNGSNTVYVHVLQDLYANISHVGDIYYEGNPQVIEVQGEGEGNILKR